MSQPCHHVGGTIGLLTVSDTTLVCPPHVNTLRCPFLLRLVVRPLVTLLGSGGSKACYLLSVDTPQNFLLRSNKVCAFGQNKTNHVLLPLFSPVRCC